MMTGCAALKQKLRGVLWVCAVTMAIVPVMDAIAQSTPGAPAPAGTTEKLPAFEVASIKPNVSGGDGESSGFQPGRFTATNASVKTLLEYNAYGISSSQIVGGPGWLSSEKFDISAKADDATVEHMKALSREHKTELQHQMVQQLLAERFKLAVHWETKELPVYALVAAKGGPKLTAAKDTSGGASTSSGNGKLTAKGITMTRLAQTLTRTLGLELGRDLIDKTGLEGRYDFVLTWSPQENSAAMADPSNEIQTGSGSSIFTALQEQLGLKLESTKGPVATLVIDHLEQPSAN